MVKCKDCLWKEYEYQYKNTKGKVKGTIKGTCLMQKEGSEVSCTLFERKKKVVVGPLKNILKKILSRKEHQSYS